MEGYPMRRAVLLSLLLGAVWVAPVSAAPAGGGCGGPFERWSIDAMRTEIFAFPAGSLEAIDTNGNGFLCIRHSPARPAWIVIDDRPPAFV
jgi:hypothetical protein